MGAVVIYPLGAGPTPPTLMAWARPNRHGIASIGWVADGWLAYLGDRLALYTADTVLHWEDCAPTVEVYAFTRAKPGVERDEFERRYRAHAALARHHHPGLCRYEQAFVTKQEGDLDRPVDAIARLGFATDDDRRSGMERDETSRQAVEDDIAGYLDRPAIWSVVCDVGAGAEPGMNPPPAEY